MVGSEIIVESRVPWRLYMDPVAHSGIVTTTIVCWRLNIAYLAGLRGAAGLKIKGLS